MKLFIEISKMALKLNQENEYRKTDGQKFPVFREFYGPNIAQMPVLIASSRTPMSFAGVMQRKLDVRNAEADVNTAWMDNYFDTIDGNAKHPDGKIKFVPDSRILREMTPQSQRNGGALALADGVYETLEGEEFTKAQVEKYAGKWLNKKSAKSNPFWKAFARQNQDLLNDFADYIAFEYQQRFAKNANVYDIEILGVFPGDKPKSPEMRAWCGGGLVDGSDADGGDDLDDEYGRLVGELAPEAQAAKNLGVQNIREYSMADIQTFDKAIKGLEGTLHPDVLKPFVDLRKKL